MYEYEWEAMYEGEGEWEWEAEAEGEYEAEEFFRRLAGLARSAAHNPTLRRVGLAAGRTALRGLGNMGRAVGGELGGRQGAALGGQLGGMAGRYLSGLLPQNEFEYEGEFEYESMANPLRRVYPDALMEHLGHAAAEAESEAEAEAFIGALVPLAARLIPRVAPAVMRAAPQLIRGLSGVTRTLRSNPQTRQLVRTLPTVMRRTAGSLAQQAAQGRAVTPQRAVRTLAQQTSRVVGSPRQAVQAYRRSRALDRRHHQAVGPAAAAVGQAAGGSAAASAGAPCHQCGQALMG
jgi:hypothetical protein